MKKTIRQLCSAIDNAAVTGDDTINIEAITHDSRRRLDNALFACIRGAHVDGHDFIAQAVEHGAVAVLIDRPVEIPSGITAISVPDVHAALQKLTPYFYDYPTRKMRLIGITGTNGKTTTTYLLRAILRRAGYRVGVIGTIQTIIGDTVYPIHNTTPDVLDLYEMFDNMVKAGVDYAVMEVSSHALAQNRVAGCEFDVAIFTNLTQDHLDYHKTLSNYAAAKARLFDMLGGADDVKDNKHVVINTDDNAGTLMLRHSRVNKITFAINDKTAMLTAAEVEVMAKGSRFTVKGRNSELPLKLPLTGIFNVYNVLGAIGAAKAENIADSVIKEALENFTSVPGRFELVDCGQDFTVIVDYAHTPDGLDNILRTARQIAARRIITVFGCGGDRDNTKRPVMGRLAAELSDVVIATSDNPRTEDPELILTHIEAGLLPVIGAKEYHKITDRQSAIYKAVSMAEPGDIVVIAGKGHENYQILQNGTIHFDDRETARAAIEELRR